MSLQISLLIFTLLTSKHDFQMDYGLNQCDVLDVPVVQLVYKPPSTPGGCRASRWRRPGSGRTRTSPPTVEATDAGVEEEMEAEGEVIMQTSACRCSPPRVPT